MIEPSIGVDRLFLALICSAYAEDEVDGEKRVLLKFHPSIAPIKVTWEADELGAHCSCLLGRSADRERVVVCVRCVGQVGIFPLVKNKPEIMEKARQITDRLKKRYNVFFDASGAIGRR